jgi:Ca-activated chloride channel family protein
MKYQDNGHGIRAAGREAFAGSRKGVPVIKAANFAYRWGRGMMRGKLAHLGIAALAILGLTAISPAGFGVGYASKGFVSGPQEGQQSRPRRSTEGQDDRPIRLSTDLVTVLTSVYDSTGNQVNDLTKNDFQLFEDNKPQEIQGLYREDQVPLKLVFLFDTSLSIKHRFDFEQRAAAQFFRQVMRPEDQAAIFSVSTDPRLELQFTSDVNKLVNTLSRLQPGGATSLYNAMIEGAKYLRPAEGRHVMVVLSDGDDTASVATLAQALNEVQKSDAMVYAVHSTGVAPSANVQDLSGEFVLKAMSEDTGGRAFFPPIYKEQEKEVRDLDDIYRKIAAEVRAQYVLTYYSNGESKDGRFRSIKVETRRAGLQVRARRGYYSEKAP